MNVTSLTSSDTGELLDRFRQHADQDAFAELVRRYSGLVFGAAMRSLGNNAALAEEAAQSTFIQLAQHAGHLSSDAALGGWLHRVTCRIASNLRRGESRRRLRESAMPSPEPDNPEPSWQQLAPVLDAALDRLETADRLPVILRFFENRSARDIAIALQLSEEAAKKRLQRALGKLRRLIGKQGVTLSATALPALLSGVILTPSSKAATWSAAALASPGVPAVTATGETGGTSLSWLTGAAAALVASTPFLWPAAREHFDASAPSSASQKALARTPSASPAQNTSPFAPFTGTSLEDIIAALERAAQGPSHIINTWRREAIAARAPAGSLPALLDRVRARPILSGKGAIIRTLLQRWSRTDPAAALNYVEAHHLDRAGTLHTWALFTSWAGKDAKAASQWLLQPTPADGTKAVRSPDPKLAAHVLELLVRNFTAADAIAFAEKLPPGEARTRALTGLAGDNEMEDWRSGWTAPQRESFALSLAEACRGPLSSEPFRRYLTRWATRDEAAASAWLLRQSDPEIRLVGTFALLAISSFQVQTGPMSYTHKQVTDREARASAALAASTGLLPPEEALNRIALSWPGKYEPLVDWLKNQDPSLNTDTALALTASRMLSNGPSRPGGLSESPPPALACAESIRDETLREQTLCGLYRRWYQRNPQAATAFIDTSGWPADRVAWLKSVTSLQP